jgi:hypothetical protein
LQQKLCFRYIRIIAQQEEKVNQIMLRKRNEQKISGAVTFFNIVPDKIVRPVLRQVFCSGAA